MATRNSASIFKTTILLVIVGLAFAFTIRWIIGCSEEPKEYTIVYEVFWTNTRSETFTKTNTKGYYVGSDRGTNFIKEGSITGARVIKTSAPIRVISYTSIKLK